MPIRQLRLLVVAASAALLLLVYFSKSESYTYNPVGVSKEWLLSQGSEKFVHRPYANSEPKKIPVAAAVEEHIDDEGTLTVPSEENDDVYYDHTGASNTPVRAPTLSAPRVAASATKAVVKATTQPKVSVPSSSPAEEADVDWTRFAYAQYATNQKYVCNSIMIFEALHRLGAKAERVLMYPPQSLEDPAGGKAQTPVAKLLLKARDDYNVTLLPIHVQHRESSKGSSTWSDSYTKLLAFNLTQYDRVLSLDSDSTVLAPMDELFLLPKCKVAAPMAYWLLGEDSPKKMLSSQLMLIQPDTDEFARVQEQINSAASDEYDMEIINEMYLDSAVVLPHRPYDLLSGEFRRADNDHESYLGSSSEVWDPEAVLAEAKLVHFSDWPVPKPWVEDVEGTRHDLQPECVEMGDGRKDCKNREIWNELYEDYAQRRLAICNIALTPM